MAVILDYGPGKNPVQNMSFDIWRSGRMYFIYDASVEGDGSPEYGWFSSSEDSETCKIEPSGRSNIRCRSEEEFNELALKYFGISQPMATMSVVPSVSTPRTAAEPVISTAKPTDPLPPNTKIAAIPVVGSATSERNPGNSLN